MTGLTKKDLRFLIDKLDEEIVSEPLEDNEIKQLNRIADRLSYELANRK